MKSRIGVTLCFAMILSIGASKVSPQQVSNSAAEVTNAHIVPPPMGWSSWNSFSNRIDSAITMQQAKALVRSGMAKAGYRYVNIDEGWWLGHRDKVGNIVVDPKQWPAILPGEKAGDMRNIVRYIHGLGLKAGIYTDAGKSGCSFYGPDLGPPMPHTGSEGHYDQDFLQFAKWGFDYVKVDWCGGNAEHLDPKLKYSEIAKAIDRAERKTGHALYFSICDWGNDSPWKWAPGVGGVVADIWRTSGDIVAPIVANSPNSDRKASFGNMLRNFDQGIHPEAQHTGFYNDPDMMVLGMAGLTDAQNRVHMALWAISGSPLIVGADLTTLGPEILSILTNPEVIAIDQDPLGLQAIRVSGENSRVEIWDKKLVSTSGSNGRRAVVLLNRSASDATINLHWNQIGLESGTASVRDVWKRKEIGQFCDSFQAVVPAGNARMLVIEGRETKGAFYKASVTFDPDSSQMKAYSGREWKFSNVRSPGGEAWIRILYLNQGNRTDLMELRFNGQRISMLAFPPTGNSKLAAITIEGKVPKGTHASEISLLSAHGSATIPKSIYVLPAEE